MEQALIIVFLVVVIALVALVMMQQGRGADAGASFGTGASQTVFGSSGSGNFLSRATTILAIVFFVVSLGLAYVAKQKTLTASDLIPVVNDVPQADVPVVEQADQSSEVPEAPQS